MFFKDARQRDVAEGPGAIPHRLVLSPGRFSNGEISEKQKIFLTLKMLFLVVLVVLFLQTDAEAEHPSYVYQCLLALWECSTCLVDGGQ